MNLLKAIQELCPHKDAFGATYYVIRNMVHSLLGCMLDSDGDNLKYECLYRKK